MFILCFKLFLLREIKFLHVTSFSSIDFSVFDFTTLSNILYVLCSSRYVLIIERFRNRLHRF